jgi:8-oxo-dGTP pyrophosphatase MutT (NUDIX family)
MSGKRRILEVVQDSWLNDISLRLQPPDAHVDLPPDLRTAAVLAVLYELEGQLVLPLIERSQGAGVHSGQLALPGGSVEPGDRDLAAAALREAQEEVGISPHNLRVLGCLPPVRIIVSGFIAFPFVAWSSEPLRLFPNDAEVAAIVLFPVRILRDPTQRREIPNPPGSLHPVMYEYRLPEGRLWGATARMLYNLGRVLMDMD